MRTRSTSGSDTPAPLSAGAPDSEVDANREEQAQAPKASQAKLENPRRMWCISPKNLMSL
jgi:hypothetical protein